MNRIRQLVTTIVAAAAFATTAANAAEDSIPVNPELDALDKHRPVRTVVAKYFPEATCILFENKLHFEASTHLYVARAIVKVPMGQPPPLVWVRGPKQSEGVWCDIALLKGSSKPYSRAEGALEREYFVEHKIYQDLHGVDRHLYVTLRVPKGDNSADFVKEFTALIRSYSHDFVTDE